MYARIFQVFRSLIDKKSTWRKAYRHKTHIINKKTDKKYVKTNFAIKISPYLSIGTKLLPDLDQRAQTKEKLLETPNFPKVSFESGGAHAGTSTCIVLEQSFKLKYKVNKNI